MSRICDNCAQELPDNAVVCNLCGKNLNNSINDKPVWPITNAAPASPPQALPAMPYGGGADINVHYKNGNGAEQGTAAIGKLFISGNGKGNSAIRFWWVVNIATGVFGVIILWLILERYRESYSFFSWYRIDNSSAINTYGFLGSVFIIAVAIAAAAIMGKSIKNTRLDVYEDCVSGVAVSKYFALGDYRGFKFTLTYDQITSVDVVGQAITVRASNAKYKCYVNNADEIQNVIHQLRELNK